MRTDIWVHARISDFKSHGSSASKYGGGQVHDAEIILDVLNSTSPDTPDQIVMRSEFYEFEKLRRGDVYYLALSLDEGQYAAWGMTWWYPVDQKGIATEWSRPVDAKVLWSLLVDTRYAVDHAGIVGDEIRSRWNTAMLSDDLVTAILAMEFLEYIQESGIDTAALVDVAIRNCDAFFARHHPGNLPEQSELRLLFEYVEVMAKSVLDAHHDESGKRFADWYLKNTILREALERDHAGISDRIESLISTILLTIELPERDKKDVLTNADVLESGDREQ